MTIAFKSYKSGVVKDSKPELNVMQNYEGAATTSALSVLDDTYIRINPHLSSYWI
jgi:hypothetical protein